MKVRVGDLEVEAEGMVERRDDGSLRITVAGVTKTAWVDGDRVWVDGRVRRVRPVAAARAEAVPDRVTPPMPATVVRVLVAVGDAVEAGQKVVVVAAMKMETTLRAPRAGVVRAVNVTPGQQVRPGEELVEIGEGS